MLIHKKSIILGVVFLMLASIWAVSADSLIDQNGVLAGRVVTLELVAIGSPVKEGTVLARVESIAGTAVAARATRDGIVREVFVKQGDMVRVGQLIARIEPAVK